MTNREFLRRIGRNIRNARVKLGMTQECLAELIGVHWQTVSAIERGRYSFSIVTFARITQFLQVSGNRLLEGLKPPDARRTKLISRALTRKRRSAKEQSFKKIRKRPK
ncbi:MAG TPA: helix-turn-helix transcriptional regulator [Verrucomicrobiae bacterium]|nr:helix-turn-helix transcriptional regulator [Verrucomicrobiae bacterium]